MRKPSRWTYAVSALALLALTVAGFYYFSGGTDQINSLAVLPFENAGTDSEMEYLGDGITETIINSLSQLPDIKVISSASSLRYKGREVDPETVGQELGVQAVVLGRIVPRGDEIAVSAELVDTRDNTQIWGERYQRDLVGLFAVQEEMAAEISRALRVRLSREDEARLKGRHSENAEAYQAYLKGRFYWNKRTEEGFRQAIDYFQEAIERDPGYALAYTGMADSYSLLGYYHLPPKEVYPKASAAALKALEIDETLAEAHASLGLVKFLYDWTFPEAEKELQRAIELDPAYAMAHHWYSAYLEAMGRYDEAVDEVRLALELDPLSLIINADLGERLYDAGRYDQAIEQLIKTLEMDASFASTHHYLGKAYFRKSMVEEAIKRYQKLAELREGWDGHLGYIYAISGRREEALNVLKRLQELSVQRRVSSTGMAAVYAGLDEKTVALEWLDKAFVDRDAGLLFIRVEPYSDALKTDPRYTDLLRRIGLEP
jgi:TolB-like protein/Flp pilus assembly protein TadD